MTSLTDVYDGDAGSVVNSRRRLLGTGLLVTGAVMVVTAIVVGTSGLRTEFGLGLFEARRIAGVLAGVGLPAGIVGFFAVLPASRTVRAAAAIGSSIALLGVTLFAYAYPYKWLHVNPGLTAATILVYSLGTLITVWCLFVALATFKTRNDPGGTARIAITEEGTIRVVSGKEHLPQGFGSVGLFGHGPDGSVETQTNRPDRQSNAGVASHGRPTSDGGTAVADPDAADAEILDAVQTRAKPDEYCGNCSHFRYVRVDGELSPYCGLTEEQMADMDACEDWTPNH